MELNELCRCGGVKRQHGDIKYPGTAVARVTPARGHGSCHHCNNCPQYTFSSFADSNNQPVEDWRQAQVISQ